MLSVSSLTRYEPVYRDSAWKIADRFWGGATCHLPNEAGTLEELSFPNSQRAKHWIDYTPRRSFGDREVFELLILESRARKLPVAPDHESLSVKIAGVVVTVGESVVSFRIPGGGLRFLVVNDDASLVRAVDMIVAAATPPVGGTLS